MTSGYRWWTCRLWVDRKPYPSAGVKLGPLTLMAYPADAHWWFYASWNMRTLYDGWVRWLQKEKRTCR